MFLKRGSGGRHRMRRKGRRNRVRPVSLSLGGSSRYRLAVRLRVYSNTTLCRWWVRLSIVLNLDYSEKKFGGVPVMATSKPCLQGHAQVDSVHPISAQYYLPLIDKRRRRSTSSGGHGADLEVHDHHNFRQFLYPTADSFLSLYYPPSERLRARCLL